MASSPFSLLQLCSEIVDNRGRTCPVGHQGRPLIATNCIKEENLYPVYETERYVSDETYATWFRGHPQPGDILFVTKGSPGRVCMVPDPTDFCIAQDMVALRANRALIHPSFFFALLRSEATKKQIENMHVGTMIPHFKKGDFDKLWFNLPDLSIQESIGEFYLYLSKKIENQKSTNIILEAIAQAIFKSWFVDFDPVKAKAEGREPDGMDAATAALFPSTFEDSELGPIPQGWTVQGLDAVAVNVRVPAGKDLFTCDTKYVGLEHISKRSLALSNWSTADTVESGKSCFQPMDILFGKLRPYFHKVCVAPFHGVCSTDILVLRPTSEEYYGLALMYAFSDNLIAYATRLSNGAKMPRSSWSDLAGYRIVMPDRPSTQHFTSLIKTMIAKVLLNIEEMKSLAALRDTLLPKLMSGQLRVPEAEAIVAQEARDEV